MNPIRIPANDLQKMVDSYLLMVSSKDAFEAAIADYTELTGVSYSATKRAVTAYAKSLDNPPDGNRFFSDSSVQYRLALGLFPHLMDMDRETGEVESGQLSAVVDATERGVV